MPSAQDGNNITQLLEDLEVSRAAYPHGYRNVLVTSNFTKNNTMVANWVHTILGFRGDEVPQGALCSNDDLVKDLIAVEWTHKMVRFNWVKGEVDEELFQQVIHALIGQGCN